MTQHTDDVWGDTRGARLLSRGPGHSGRPGHRAGPAPAATTSPGGHLTDGNAGVQVDLAAWSVNSNPNGTVSVTVRQMVDPAGLRKTLAKAGIPAVVSVEQLASPSTTCDNQGTKLGMKGVIVATPRTAGAPGVTIRPAAIPKGATIGFAVLMKGTRPIYVLIAVFKGTPPTCSR